MKRTALLTTAILALAIAGAATQASAQSIVRGAAAPPAQVANPDPDRRAIPSPANTGTRTPRFVVEILSIYANEESGATNLGDDEVSVVIHAGNYWTATERFEDFDNNETRLIAANQSCAFPARDTDGSNRSWGCDINGAPNPGVITLEVREHDEPFFDPFGLEDLCILPNTLTSDLLSAPYPCTAEDTLIGSYEIDLSSYGRNSVEGQSWETEMTMGGYPVGQYTVRYRITRAYDIVDSTTPPALSQR